MTNVTESRLRKATKFVVSGTVSTSVAFVVGNIIKNNTDDPENKTETVKYWVGGMTLGMVVASHCKSATDRQIDALFDVFKRDKDAIKTIPNQ